MLRKIHSQGVYAIARISVFQDTILAKGKPGWALKKSDGSLWLDRKGLAWLDPASQPVWDYNIAIAKEALSRGFDEVNFDYLRFPSDGDMQFIQYPYWDKKVDRHVIIRNFFSHLREKMPEAKMSADIFGQTTSNTDDLGIGQIIEDAYQYFDYVSPMVYPSHYSAGFLGYSNPAAHPYEVVKYAIERGVSRLIKHKSNGSSSLEVASSGKASPSVQAVYRAKLRPWLQDFDLGAVYGPEEVRAQIRAVTDGSVSDEDTLNGWMLWSSSNIYTTGALLGPD